MINNTLTIAPIVESIQEVKEIQLNFEFNSNGKIVNKQVVVKLTTSTVAPFEFNEKEVTLEGKEKTLTLAVTGLAEETIEWSSSHPEIVRVSEDGTVIGVTYGTAIITAKSKIRPTLSAKCSVTVKRPAMTLKESSVELYVGETKKEC